MKLRIHHQCIRFRLSQTDVERLIQFGELSETVKLSAMVDAVFGIRLRKIGSRSQAYMRDSTLCIDVAEDQCQRLETSDLITVEETIDVSEGACLRIIIEKDFGCLKPRTGLDDVDTFPNPLSAIASC